MTELSHDTRAFLRDWLDWVDQGAPEGNPYSRLFGLCSNSVIYSKAAAFGLYQAFNTIYPFGAIDYYDRKRDATMHECPKRLAFARKHAL